MQGVFSLPAGWLEWGYPVLLQENGHFCAVVDPDGLLLSLDMLPGWPSAPSSPGSCKATNLDWGMWRCCAAPMWARVVQCGTYSWPSRKLGNLWTQRCFSHQSLFVSHSKTLALAHMEEPGLGIKSSSLSSHLVVVRGLARLPSCFPLAHMLLVAAGFISSWCDLEWHRAAAYKINENVL